MARDDIKNDGMLVKRLEEIQSEFFSDLAEKCSEDDILLIAKILSHILTLSEVDEEARIKKAVIVARNYLSALAKTKSLVDFPQIIGGLIIPIKQEVNQFTAEKFENEISPDHLLKSLLQRFVDECVRSVKEQDSSRIDSRFFNRVIISELNNGQRQQFGFEGIEKSDGQSGQGLLSNIENVFRDKGILSENKRAREAVIFLLGDRQYGIELQLLTVIAHMFNKIGITNRVEREEISVNLTSDHGSIKVEYSGSFKLFESSFNGDIENRKQYKGSFEANINLVPEDGHFTIQMSKFEFDLRDPDLIRETKFCLLGSRVLSPNSSLKTPETQQEEKSAKHESAGIEEFTQKEWKASIKALEKIEKEQQKLEELVLSGDFIDRKLKNFEALKTAYAKFEQIRNKYKLSREQQLSLETRKDPLSDNFKAKRTVESDAYFEKTYDEVIAQALLYGEAHDYAFVETEEPSIRWNLAELAKILLEHAEQLSKNVTDENKLADLQTKIEFLQQIRDGKLNLLQPSVNFDNLLLEIRKAPPVERVTDSQLHDKAIDVLLEAKQLLAKQEWLKESLNRYLNKNETDDIVPGHVQSLFTKLEQQRIWLEKEIKGGLNKSMSNYEEFGILIRKAYRSLEAGDISVAMSIYQQMLIVPEWQKYLKSHPQNARQVSSLYNTIVNAQTKAIKEVAAKYFLQINLDDLYAQKSDELTQFAEYFNKLPNHVRETILSKSSLPLRIIQTEYWLWVANQCYLNGDFCSSTAIMIGLQMVLGKLLTEDDLSTQAQNRYSELKELTGGGFNWKELRRAMDNCQQAVPLMLIYLGDLDKIKERDRLGNSNIKLNDSTDAHKIVDMLKSKQEHLRESYTQSLSSPAATKLKRALYSVNEIMKEFGELEQEADSIYSTVLELWNRISADDQPHDISELNFDNLKKKIEELESKVNDYPSPAGNREIWQLKETIKDTINKTQKMLVESVYFSEFDRDRSILCKEIIEHLINYQQHPDDKDNFIRLVMKTKFVTRGNKGGDDLLLQLEGYLEPHLPLIKYFAGMLLPRQIARLTWENMENAFYELLDSLKNIAKDTPILENAAEDDPILDNGLPFVVHFLSGIMAKLEHDFIPELNNLQSRVAETETAIMDHFHELITQILRRSDVVQADYDQLVQLTDQLSSLKTDIKEHLDNVNENSVLFDIRNDLLTRINNKYELSNVFIKPKESAADLKKLLTNPPSTIHLRNKLQQITQAKFSDQEAADIKQVAFHAMIENEKLAKILEGHTLKSRHAHSKNIFSYKSTSKCIDNLNKAMRKQDLNQVNHWLNELNVDVSNDQLQKELGSMDLVTSGTRNIASLVGLTAGSVAVTAATLGTGLGVAALGALATAVATGGISYFSQRKSTTPLSKFGLFAEKNAPETSSVEGPQETQHSEQTPVIQSNVSIGME
ncbi:MAG: hypothetical protein AMJ43_05735 [Coxiella sp. DG_40]|nr:MAG: hypothetical protein AMJ43_05735 [Coxiella sp. DG_40]